jgi:hypothetical protein
MHMWGMCCDKGRHTYSTTQGAHTNTHTHTRTLPPHPPTQDCLRLLSRDDCALVRRSNSAAALCNLLWVLTRARGNNLAPGVEAARLRGLAEVRCELR